ncbi:MAG: polysaccharide deacetylase family protein [Dehalococcoidia bacterium]
MKTLTAAIANRLALLDVYAFLRKKITGSLVAIVLYHQVCPPEATWIPYAISPHSFEMQIEYFCRNYELLSLDTLATCIQSGESLPEKAVVITFDDGQKDDYLYAYPILKKYHVPATIFLVTGYVGADKLFWWDRIWYPIQHTTVKQLTLGELGSYCLRTQPDRVHTTLRISEALKKLPEDKKNLLIEKLVQTCSVDIPPDLSKELSLSWDEIREMSNAGIAFGAHTVNHPILTNIPLAQARWEITQSKEVIERRLGKEVTTFAYPNGNFADFNTDIAEVIKESGFKCAVTVSPMRLVSSKDNPYTLSRICPLEDFNKFKIMLCGLWGDFNTIFNRKGNDNE